MHGFLATGLSFALCAGLAAQGTVVTPWGFDKVDGSSNTSYPFSAKSFRFQQTITDLKGTPRVFKSLGLRPDAYYSCGTCGARTVEVEIVMAHTDAAKTSKTFAANYAGTPVTVFARAKVNLPDRSKGPSGQVPMPPDVIFLFQKPFNYDGKQDLLYDIKTWNNTGTGSYYSDYVTQGGRVYADRRTLGTGCTAVGQTNAMRLASLTSAESVSGAYKFRLYWYTNYGPKNAPCTTLIGVSDPNTAVPGLCTNVRVVPLVDVPKTSSSTGYFNTRDASGNYVYVPYDRAAVGLVLHAQSAGIDKGSSQAIPVAASNGLSAKLPPAADFVAKRVMHFSDANATVGAGPYSGSIVTVLGY